MELTVEQAIVLIHFLTKGYWPNFAVNTTPAPIWPQHSQG